MTRLLSTLLILFFLLSAAAQTELSSFTSTGAGYTTASINDYQALGINPANLGWTRNDHTMNLGFFEFATSVYSEPLTKKQLWNDIYGSNPVELDAAGKTQAAKDFTDARLFGINNLMYIGFSYQDEKIGGFAINVREKIVWNSYLNENAASFLFQGYNADYFDIYETNENGDTIAGYSSDPQWADSIYRGTDQDFLMYREINFGYGRKVIKNEDFAWYLGIGFKYVQGYAMLRYHQDGDNLVANSALSPAFGLEYDEPTPSKIEGAGLKKVGSGYGIDIGTTFEIKQKVRIGLAVNDIGQINWNGNVYEGVNGKAWKIETAGMDNYNIFEQGELISTDNGPPPDTTNMVGLPEKTIKLPMNFRGGVSYTINEAVEVGFDAYIPIGEKVPGMFLAPVYGIGVRANPANWVQLSIGVVTGGKFGTNMPFGVTFYPIKHDQTTWEIGLATRDMLTLFSQVNPTVSIAFGFLRFSFGEKKDRDATRYQEEE